MITREQVADLRPGDVVEMRVDRWAKGTTLCGPVWAQRTGDLFLADILIRHADGRPNSWDGPTLTVVSRAPRPLYVNHDRAEPVPGDVVRDASGLVLFRTRSLGWIASSGLEYDPRRSDGLRLLVDGTTGQVVP